MFTEEQLKEANEKSLLGLFQERNYALKQVGKHEYKVLGLGGLFVDSERNTWYCFSLGKGGGPIQFLQEFLMMEWKDSVNYLLKQENITITASERENDEAKEKKGSLELPEKAEKYRRLYAYLIKTRKIDKEVVDFFVKKKSIYENDKGGIVFLGHDKEGVIKYAMIRGTSESKPFKAEVKNSDKRYSFSFRNIKSDTLIICESAIDAMSYASLRRLENRNYIREMENLLSLGGISEMPLKVFLEEHSQIKNLIFSLDNDEAGERAYQKFKKEYQEKFNVKRIKFEEKDINEYLQKIVKRKEAQRQLEGYGNEDIER